MKKKKLDSGGFVLVETLVVTVFIMVIFAILYNNFYPLIGEYEKREVYDDIDGKYAAYWIKRIIQDSSYEMIPEKQDTIETKGYIKFSCEEVSNEEKKKMCYRIVDSTQVRLADDGTPNIYLTNYNLQVFKEKINEDSTLSGGVHKYLNYLPDYNTPSLNNAKYRIIVEFNRIRDNNDYLAYSTIEVKK